MPLEKEVNREAQIRAVEGEIKKMQEQNRKMRLAWKKDSKLIQDKLGVQGF